MKKLFLLAAVAIMATGASAQVSWNVNAGFNLSNHLGDYGDMKVKPGFRVGVGMEYQFNDLISLQPSLRFSTKGAKSDEIKFGDISYSSTINQMYVELPVMVGFRFYVGRSTNIVLSVGPYIAYGVGGKIKNKLKTGTSLGNILAEGDTFDTLKPFDAGAAVGAAVEFGQFFVGIDSQFGLTKLYDFDNIKNTNINIGIGVGFKF